ncbi:MAG: hypothetical protein U5N53_07890, partial [Mycobacterium sp.]|nr:hypothetical protein [Mycobacterium sp.]
MALLAGTLSGRPPPAPPMASAARSSRARSPSWVSVQMTAAVWRPVSVRGRCSARARGMERAVEQQGDGLAPFGVAAVRELITLQLDLCGDTGQRRIDER